MKHSNKSKLIVALFKQHQLIAYLNNSIKSNIHFFFVKNNRYSISQSSVATLQKVHLKHHVHNRPPVVAGLEDVALHVPHLRQEGHPAVLLLLHLIAQDTLESHPELFVFHSEAGPGSARNMEASGEALHPLFTHQTPSHIIWKKSHSLVGQNPILTREDTKSS